MNKAGVNIFTAKDDANGVIVFGAAMGTPSGYYKKLASYFAAQGWHCVLVKARGEEGMPPAAKRGVDFGYTEMINEDFANAVAVAKAEFSDLPVVASGHSLGGHVALMYAGRYPEMIDAVMLLASGTPHMDCFPEKVAKKGKMLLTVIPLLSFIYGYFPGNRLGFAGKEAKRLMRDWLQLTKYNRIDLSKDEFDYEQAIAELQKPVLGYAYAGDTLAPVAAVSGLAGKVLGSNRQVLSHQQEDGVKAFNHFDWTKDPATSVQPALAWLQGQLTS